MCTDCASLIVTVHDVPILRSTPVFAVSRDAENDSPGQSDATLSDELETAWQAFMRNDTDEHCWDQFWDNGWTRGATGH